MIQTLWPTEKGQMWFVHQNIPGHLRHLIGTYIGEIGKQEVNSFRQRSDKIALEKTEPILNAITAGILARNIQSATRNIAGIDKGEPWLFNCNCHSDSTTPSPNISHQWNLPGIHAMAYAGQSPFYQKFGLRTRDQDRAIHN